MKNLLLGNKLNCFNFPDSKLVLAERELLKEKILHLIFLQREQKLLSRDFALSINFSECYLPKQEVHFFSYFKIKHLRHHYCNS